MKLHSEIIKLDLEAGFVQFEPEDWRMCPREYGLMHHQPTQTDYFVDMPSEAYANPDKAFSIFQFEARLVMVPDGRPLPSLKEQTEVGRAAIIVFLQLSGLWEEPNVYDVADRPEDQRKTPDRKLVN
jgi:hypothetical protein